jgi:hypothetical protein
MTMELMCDRGMETVLRGTAFVTLGGSGMSEKTMVAGVARGQSMSGFSSGYTA